MAAFLFRYAGSGISPAYPTPAEITPYILPMINKARAAAGAQPLKEHSGLAAVAQNWSETMASDQNLRHNPNYTTQVPSGWSLVSWARTSDTPP